MGGSVNRLERFRTKRQRAPVTEPIGNCMSKRPFSSICLFFAADRGGAPPPHPQIRKLGPRCAGLCLGMAKTLPLTWLSLPFRSFFGGGGGCFAPRLRSAPLESHVSRRRVRGL